MMKRTFLILGLVATLWVIGVVGWFFFGDTIREHVHRRPFDGAVAKSFLLPCLHCKESFRPHPGNRWLAVVRSTRRWSVPHCLAVSRAVMWAAPG